ncbi:hypothetical protein DQ04_04051000 [Trypanosoma grayi]|uniref:hypothetical protein n=1 Tax=Trypanosoma grayi TaxID=71804 RepID=UPI0004F41B70|nr:hypothetical protein DQ04_04051000 [Trypanosoma grayi]KEG10201.1 hypothetical protein DQ04_04051000 [Trypanosoma grayi]
MRSSVSAISHSSTCAAVRRISAAVPASVAAFARSVALVAWFCASRSMNASRSTCCASSTSRIDAFSLRSFSSAAWRAEMSSRHVSRS